MLHHSLEADVGTMEDKTSLSSKKVGANADNVIVKTVRLIACCIFGSWIWLFVSVIVGRWASLTVIV